jgi:hypothetical protein
MVPAMLNGKYAIRFCVNHQNSTEDDIKAAWELITNGIKYDPTEISASAIAKMRRLSFGMSKLNSDSNNNSLFVIKEDKKETEKKDQPVVRHRFLARECSIIKEEIDDENH